MNKRVKDAYVFLGSGFLAIMFLSAAGGVWHQKNFVCDPMDQGLAESFNDVVKAGDLFGTKAAYWDLLDHVENDKVIKKAGCEFPMTKLVLSTYNASI